MAIAIICAAVFGVLLAVTVLPDAIPALCAFVGRVGIGRWTDPVAWREQMIRAGRRMAMHPKPIPVTERRHQTLLLRLSGHYASKLVMLWHHGVLSGAIGTADEHPNVKRVRDRLLLDKPLPELAVSAFYALRRGDHAPWTDELARRFLEIGVDGTVYYRASARQDRFVDTLWMLCPFLFCYAQKTGDPCAGDLAKRQLEEYLRIGIHPTTGLPAHAFEIDSKAPLGVYGWGRGCGFLFLALIESLGVCGADTKEYLLRESKKCAETLLATQRKDGGWSALALVQTGAEASASAMIGYGMAELALRLPNGDALRAQCKQSAQSARHSLMRFTRRNGLVDFAQGDSHGGIGMYAASREPLPLAQGYAIRLARTLQLLEGADDGIQNDA
ncbi:MAG: glycoside hydrolase family 88 protein [Oscillospiraceae bacterium]|nr:glycoside hydrolase family 88 protein [Oscillospiraceae bacterium]